MKGPGGSEEQDLILKRWRKKGYPFHSKTALDNLVSRARDSGTLVLPTNAKKLSRLQEMATYFCTVHPNVSHVTLDHVVALGRQPAGRREAYDIVCAAFGAMRRGENSAREPRYARSEGDSAETAALKERLALLSHDESILQRDWQHKLEAFRASQADVLSTLKRIQLERRELDILLAAEGTDEALALLTIGEAEDAPSQLTEGEDHAEASEFLGSADDTELSTLLD
jgi:hypothetical protein